MTDDIWKQTVVVATPVSGDAAGWWALSAPGGILEQMVAVDESEGLRKLRPDDDGTIRVELIGHFTPCMTEIYIRI